MSEHPRQLERVDWSPSREPPPDLSAWPYSIPAVAQLVAAGGLEIPPGITFLIGENGSGKSTLVEALAAVYPRRGFATPFVDKLGPAGSAEDSPLLYHLRARTHARASPAGFFLRAEAMHQYLAGIDADPGQAGSSGRRGALAQSHGESFLAVLRHRFGEVGVYFMDEPEAALSFRSCLALIALLHEMRAEGSQVIVATHSPVLVALPGAALLELGEWGIRPAAYDELELVQSWRTFLDGPGAYLRHLLAE
ncbi:MAG TPA: AAA family ATPase [Gaiellales bacterium]|nr:AAA family ATPase [Gaiellales bacterium]